MINNKKIVAIIPARRGSKRFPGKNMALLGNKPLVLWTIEASLKSKYIDQVIVSSDDEDVLIMADKNNVKPYKRSVSLSRDCSSSVDVVLDVLDNIKSSYDYLLLLQPTSPLRTAKDIDNSIEYLSEKNANSIISVCECSHSPLWTNKLPESLSMAEFIDKSTARLRSQDLPKFYQLNGAVFICKVDILKKEKSLFSNKRSFAYIMSKRNSIDIDYSEDLDYAEFLVKKYNYLD